MRRALLVLVSLMVGACAYAAAPTPYRPAVEQVPSDNGAVLYARDCAWCHGSNGSGTERGPNLNGDLDGGAYTHFMLSSGRMPIVSPTTDAVRKPSPFTDQQIGQIVAYVETFGGTGPPVLKPDPSAGDQSRGLELYLTNCSACHSSSGVGGALTSGRAAPPLTNSDITPTQIAEAMAVGPGCPNDDPACGRGSGAMPRFDFSQQEVDDITAFITFLQTGQGDKGGWAIGRVGPVSEGAVAWLIGLGAILVVGRWIGTRVGEEE